MNLSVVRVLRRRDERMGKRPVIDRTRCMHCGACVGSCPENAATLEEVWVEFGEGCTGCGICSRACPAGAISMEGSG
ncbi:MAG: 4Fe-4S binding protein [Thermoplasmata archaeon]